MTRMVELLLYALIMGLPFEYYFQSPDQTLLTSLKLQVLLFLTSWILVKIAAASHAGIEVLRELPKLLPQRLLVSLLILTLIQILAAVLSEQATDNAVMASVKTAAGAVIFVAAADVAGTPRVRRRGLTTLSLTGVCVALIGLGELAGIEPFRSIIELFQTQRFRLTDRLRFHSTMEYPNIAGHFLSAALFATLAQVLLLNRGRAGAWRRWTWLAAASVQAATLILTYSRGATISAVVGIVTSTLILGVAIPNQFWKRVVAASAILLTAGAAYQFYVHYWSGSAPIPPRERIARFGLEAEEETKFLATGREYSERISVRNLSQHPWPRERFGVGYNWHVLGGEQSTNLEKGALFQTDLLPGETRESDITLKMPEAEGEYLLVWHVFENIDPPRAVENSFSPGIICKITPSGDSGARILSNRALYYLELIREERRILIRRDTPTRANLWAAALKMFYAHPILGVGPDNFRLLKWRYMDLPKGDERILANSLYLEFLSGSGILGLAALLWMLTEIGRGPALRLKSARTAEDRAFLYFGVAYFTAFLVHGIVDYFLKFTPTYLLFWLTMGSHCVSDGRRRGKDADRI